MKDTEMLRPHDSAGHETDFDGEGARVERFTRADGSRGVVVLPSRAKRLPEEELEGYRELMMVGNELARLTDRVDEIVPSLREGAVSWSLIGHALGLTGEAARLRWGGA